MTRSSRRLTRLACAVLLAAAALPAAAVTSTSSVLITSFSYTTSSGVLSWSDPYQSFAATALAAGGLLGGDTDTLEAPDYQLAIVGASVGAQQAAVSTTTPQTFWATAATASSNGLATYLPNRAESIAGQSGTFRLSTAGSVTFSIGYQLDVAAPGGNAVTDYGSSLLAFSLADADGNSGGSSQVQLTSFAQQSGIGNRVGSFTLTVALSAGEAGFYNLQGNALALSTAAVPEPGAAALLCSGLAGLALLARRRRQTA